jgi:hypothetical protein
VLLTDSGCTMSRRPFGSVVTTGFTDDRGTASRFTAFSAQAGSATGFVLGRANDSFPPNAFEVTGLPDGLGVMIAVMAWSRSR